MREWKVDVAVIGAGPAGLAAATGAKEAGASQVVVFERDWDLGGILQQCIHPGFGLHLFKEELTGPEYVHRWAERASRADVAFENDAMVYRMEPDGSFWAMNPRWGIRHVVPKATVLAMGCRERPRGALRLPGSRPAGVYTAGTAQRFINIEGLMPGKRVVVLGSGDIGLIMARRMVWEGASVEGVYELKRWPGGLRRNIAQCLEDYDIPLYLGHTVSKVHGKDRLEGVTVAPVDDHGIPVEKRGRFVECDTLLLAVGLIPENELSLMAGIDLCPITGGPLIDERGQTTREGIFAAGNVVVVYDLADWVSEEGAKAGSNAACYAAEGKTKKEPLIRVRGGKNVGIYSPQLLSGEGEAVIYVRASIPFERRCRLIARPGLFSKTLPYARPGEMNEVRIESDLVKKAFRDGLHEILVDFEEV